MYKTRHVTNSNLDVDPSVTSQQGVVKRPSGGVTHQAQMDVKINKIPNQSQINSSANSVCMVKDDSNVAGKVVKAHSHENVLNDMTHDGKSVNHVIVTDSPKATSVVNQMENCVRIFDVNRSSTDKYLHSALAKNKVKHVLTNDQLQCQTFKCWKSQSDFDFGFVPLSDFVLPSNNSYESRAFVSPIDQHHFVKQFDVPNFLGARSPVTSQLNVPEWERQLRDYWDTQLIHLIKFGFPLGFNRNMRLMSEKINHASALKHPSDVVAYLEEEIAHGAIVGPFVNNPIQSCHYSPFMTREKSGSNQRRVIIDLSWPRETSVNDAIDKDSYLGTEFSLTFPTVDNITTELKRLGRGAHIYKIDISRAFRHVKVDPRDYDLLGLYWENAYIDTCVPFGSRHGTQIFQRLSDAVRFMMRARGFQIVNYVDDYVGFGVPSVAERSFNALYDLLHALGFTISAKKLVSPTTHAICLGVLIDSENGTISIPEDKLRQIKQNVSEWQSKHSCTRRQLQSLLGHLIYLHKCVRPSRYFVNRMLDLLRANYNSQTIRITPEFQRDLRWFTKFLDTYNGVSIYDHAPVKHVIELDACLTGLGGRCDNLVYHLALPLGYNNLNIVHLEMVNILLAVRLFGKCWSKTRVLVKCDNEAVVQVLTSGRTRDAFLAACARNVWHRVAECDIDISYIHVLGKNNEVADLLSRWKNTNLCWQRLLKYVPNPCWLTTTESMLQIDNDI